MKSDMDKLREKQQRKRRKRTVRILILSPLIALAFAAALNLLLRIRDVTVRNGTLYPVAQVASSFPFSVGDGLLSFDAGKLTDTIPVEYPYVKSASVRRTFSGQVEISLEAAIPAMAISCADGVVVLDEDFKVLDLTQSVPDGVLAVLGMDLSAYDPGHVLDADENIQTGTVRELIGLIRENGLYDHISSLDLTKKYNITFRLYDVITVRLGNSEDLPAKFQLLLRLLSENDLTVPAEIRIRDYSEGRYVRLSTETDTDTGTSAPVSDPADPADPASPSFDKEPENGAPSKPENKNNAN